MSSMVVDGIVRALCDVDVGYGQKQVPVFT
jgi:hypothetical protein